MLMGKPTTTTKSIAFIAITIMMMMMIITIILTLTLPDTALNVSSQTVDVSENKSKLNKTMKSLDFQSPNTDSTVKEKTSTEEEEIFMKVQLVPNENIYLKDWYQVSNFSFVTSNTSKLCPSSSSSNNCKYELEDGKMAEAFDPSERSLTGKFKVDTGISKNLMNLSSIWKAVKELEKDGETIQVIEGTLKIGKDLFVPEHEYQINGTLSTYNNGYLLEIKGKNNNNNNKVFF
jgi:hypothetical protein